MGGGDKKTCNKIADLGPGISLITLHLSGLNTLIK